jgi:hypothetical protein
VVRVSRDFHLALELSLSLGFTDWLYRKVTIDTLPNDVLLGIFNFYVRLPQPRDPSSTLSGASLDTWHTLIHQENYI